MNVELKPNAQKKLDQMAATVHGVLVKNESGAWAAVSEGGRVMWLDDFEGQPSSAQPEQPGDGVVPSRDDLIQCLLATQAQSEGVMADAILSMLPTLHADGWVRCEDRLPEDMRSVLVASNTGSIYTCTRNVIEQKNNEPDGDGFKRERFTHWMPLPQPPAEQEGSGDE